jgi:DNA topoisomerase I
MIQVTVVSAIKATAQRLGNRPATCTNYYVHPAIVESYLSGELGNSIKPPANSQPAPASSL